MFFKSEIFTLLILILVNSSPAWSCSNIARNTGKGVAEEVKEGAVRTARELRMTLEDLSAKLKTAMSEGVDATKIAVRELADSISDIAKSVSVKIDTADLKEAGQAMTQNLRDAITDLSKSWDLSLNTADLKDIGAEAAKYLSEALQNIEVVVKLSVDVEVGANLVQAIMYISIAFGIGFSVCCVAMVISLKSCGKCTVALFTVCCSRNSSGSTSDTTADGMSPSEVVINNDISSYNNKDNPRELLIDRYDGNRGKIYNQLEEKLGKENLRQSLADFGVEKFSNLKNFWNNPQPNKDFGF